MRNVYIGIVVGGWRSGRSIVIRHMNEVTLNRVPTLIGLGKGGNVTSAGWQVGLALCDIPWHVSSRSGEACLQAAVPGY